MELASVSVEERCHIDRCIEDVWADLRDFGNGVGLRADGACCVSLLVRPPFSCSSAVTAGRLPVVGGISDYPHPQLPSCLCALRSVLWTGAASLQVALQQSTCPTPHLVGLLRRPRIDSLRVKSCF